MLHNQTFTISRPSKNALVPSKNETAGKINEKYNNIENTSRNNT